LVTGGGRGIGREIVRKFYNDEAHVFVIDKDAKLLDALKKELPKVTTVCVDLLDWDATKQAVTNMAPLDHLVNNAAIVGESTIMDVKPETFDKVFGVNLKAIFVVSQAFAKGIINNKKEKDGTTIVNISSVGDRIAFWGTSCYAATKAGVTMLTKSLALEFGEYGIRANCICPTVIDTDLVREADPAIFERGSNLVERVIIKDKKLSTTDIAHAVLFLSSPLSQMITGEALMVDSGTTAI